MLKKFIAIVAASAISSLAVVPMATMATFALTVTADVAEAKSNKGGKGKSAKSKVKSSKQVGKTAKKSKSKANGNKTNAQTAGKKKSTGQDKQDKLSGSQKTNGKRADEQTGLNKGQRQNEAAGNSQQPAATHDAQTQSQSSDQVTDTALATAGKQKGDLHPSNLGNMNGALNANENAIAAHIRNGNTNGPVGLMAGYVSARGTSAAARDALGDGAEPYIALNDQLVENGYVDEFGNPDLDSYLESGADNEEINETIDRINWSDQDRLLVENGFVDSEGMPDLQAYEDAGEPIDAIDLASGEQNSFDESLYSDVLDARGDLAAEDDAIESLVEYWNKQDSAPEGTEAALRDAIEARATELEGAQSVMDAIEPSD